MKKLLLRSFIVICLYFARFNFESMWSFEFMVVDNILSTCPPTDSFIACCAILRPGVAIIYLIILYCPGKVHMKLYKDIHNHDDVIKWKHFPRNWPFARGIHRPRWIPHTKASDAELRCFYPRPVLAFGYCHRLRLCVCPCVRVSVYQSLACPRDNSSAVHARITKFGWETQNTLVKMPIIFGGDWPWPSRSNLTWKSKFTSFWACPHDNFSLV